MQNRKLFKIFTMAAVGFNYGYYLSNKKVTTLYEEINDNAYMKPYTDKTINTNLKNMMNKNFQALFEEVLHGAQSNSTEFALNFII